MNDEPVILLFGAAGQVGREILKGGSRASGRIVALVKSEVDIADRPAVAAVVARHRPRLLINAAAYTAVDRAESDERAAMATNGRAPGALAEIAENIGAALIHISTDYVFSGEGSRPWREDDAIAPINAYGRTKAAGEAAVRDGCRRHVILRTAWVFSPHGNNFVKTIVRLAREKDELKVVVDQTGGPTAAADIAEAVLAIARNILGGGADRFGTFHYCGAPATTWHGLAEAIVAGAAPRLGRRPPVRPILTSEYPTPARRPRFSVLDCTRIFAVHGIAQPDWRPRLKETLDSFFSTEPG